jgi:hypothetical protein
MKVPCPVPLQSAWSPVGYHVVEVNVAQPPGQAPLPEAKIVGPAPAPLPSSPVGYRIVLVSEEKAVDPPPQPLPRLRRTSRSLPPRIRPTNLWVPLTILGSFLLLFLIGSLTLLSARTFDPPAPRVVWVNQPDQPIEPVLAAEPQVILPDGLAPAEPAAPDNVPAAAAPAPKDEGPLGDVGLLPGDVCKPAAGADKETFGTAVAFARNPLEASRLARTEGKLTFILHVSGNFEESRFT